MSSIDFFLFSVAKFVSSVWFYMAGQGQHLFYYMDTDFPNGL